MRHLLRIAAIAMMSVMVAGCLETKIEFGVKSDGSGTITQDVVMGKMALTQMTAMAGGDASKLKGMIYDEQKLKAAATKLGEGVTYVSSEYIEKADGSKGYRAVYKFDDVNKVKLDSSAVSGGGGAGGGNAKNGMVYSFAYDQGSKTLTISNSKKGQMKDEPDKPAPSEAQINQAMQMMKMFSGLKVKMTVKGLDPIKKCNANHFDKKAGEVTLMSLDMDKLLADDAKVRELASKQIKGFSEFQRMKVPGIKGQNPEQDVVVQF